MLAPRVIYTVKSTSKINIFEHRNKFHVKKVVQINTHKKYNFHIKIYYIHHLTLCIQ